MTQVTETAQDSNIAVIASVATYVAGLILYTGSLLVMVMVVMVASSWGRGARSRGRATVQHSSEARPRQAAVATSSGGDYKGSAV